ncbi:MAG: TonB-dependent receptor, partial [Marinoscillum sp.]
QTGFRNPTTQGQYISLDIISARLLGGLPQFYEFYDLNAVSSTGTPLAFTGGSVNEFRNSVFSGNSPFDPATFGLLEAVTDYDPVKPEKVKSMELGYKSLINNKLLIDAVYYYNIYTDFITQVRIVKASELTQDDADDINSEAGATVVSGGDPAYNSILNGTSNNTFQIFTNLDNTVTSQGAAIGLTYSLIRGYTLGGNYSWNKLIGGFNENTLTEFNTPEHKVNVSFANRKVTDNIGFNITYRYQTEFEWQSSFAIGNVPAFGTLDAQVSYKLESLKSILKIGGSNVLNKYYNQSLGGPNIGAIYYVSLTFDELMN